MDCFRRKINFVKVEKNFGPALHLSRQTSAAELYTLPFEKRGSVVDLWVRGGTRAVPSQCSGPPDSLVRSGFEPGTYGVSPQVSNHLATRGWP